MPFRMLKRYKENYLGALWEHSLIGCALVGPDGNWLQVNQALCDHLGYSETELKNLTFQQITHPQDVDDDVFMTRKLLLKELDYYTMSKRYITKTGSSVWIKLKVNPIFEGDDISNNVVFLLSQILPFDPMTTSKGNRGHDITDLRVKQGAFGSFIKGNWKWLLTSVGAIVLSIGGFFYQQDKSITILQRDVSVLQKDLTGISDSLDIIKDLLKK